MYYNSIKQKDIKQRFENDSMKEKKNGEHGEEYVSLVRKCQVAV